MLAFVWSMLLMDPRSQNVFFSCKRNWLRNYGYDCVSSARNCVNSTRKTFWVEAQPHPHPTALGSGQNRLRKYDMPLVRYGMVWYGKVWYGIVWYGMVWYGRV